MSSRTKFIKQLEKLLKKTKINRNDIVDAIDFLKEYKIDLRTSKLIRSGPCINCKKDIEYKGISTTHYQRGDGWILDRMEKWKSPPKIKIKYDDLVSINGLSLNTVQLYSCNDCFKELELKSERKKVSMIALKKEERQKIRDHKLKFSRWCEESLNSSTVHIADIFTTYMNEVVDYQLDHYDQRLPDYEDINDVYYEIVKRYKAYKENYICKLCGSVNSNIILIDREFLYWNDSLHKNLEAMICICNKCYSEAKTKNDNGISFGYRFEDEF